MMDEIMEARCNDYELEVAELKAQHADEIKQLNALHQEEVTALKDYVEYLALERARAEQRIEIYEAQVQMVRLLCGCGEGR